MAEGLELALDFPAGVYIIRPLKATCLLCGKEHEAYDIADIKCGMIISKFNPLNPTANVVRCKGLLIFDEVY